MADKTGIAWADATINPCAGCSPVSPACDHCYAARMAHRLAANIKIPPYFAGLTDDTGKWTGKVNLHPHLMKQVLRWQKPRKIFVGSMTDLFHEAVPDEFLDQVFAYMALAPQHTFLLLTKRPARMKEYVFGLQNDPEQAWRFEQQMLTAPNPLHRIALGFRRGKPLPNLWLGVTAENQAMADERIPILLETPAAARFVSVEPMLGPITLGFLRAPKDDDYVGWQGDGPIDVVVTRRADLLHWVIAGGETGPGARPMHPDWLRSLRDQCKAAGVPFFFKQWGEYAPCPAGKCTEVDPACKSLNEDFGSAVCRVGKHAAGRLLDGVEWNEFPAVRS